MWNSYDALVMLFFNCFSACVFGKGERKKGWGVQKDEEGFLIHHSLACEQGLRGALAAGREKETLILTLNLSLLIPPLRAARAPRGACSQANRSRSKREKGNGNVVMFLANLFPWVLKALRVPTLTGFLLCFFVLFFLVRKRSVELCYREKKASFWINNTRLAFQTCKTTIYRPHTPELKSISKFQLLFHWRNVEKYMIFYTVPWSRWNRTHTLWHVRCIVRDSGIRSNVLKQQPH